VNVRRRTVRETAPCWQVWHATADQYPKVFGSAPDPDMQLEIMDFGAEGTHRVYTCVVGHVGVWKRNIFSQDITEHIIELPTLLVWRS